MNTSAHHIDGSLPFPADVPLPLDVTHDPSCARLRGLGATAIDATTDSNGRDLLTVTTMRKRTDEERLLDALPVEQYRAELLEARSAYGPAINIALREDGIEIRDYATSGEQVCITSTMDRRRPFEHFVSHVLREHDTDFPIWDVMRSAVPTWDAAAYVCIVTLRARHIEASWARVGEACSTFMATNRTALNAIFVHAALSRTLKGGRRALDTFVGAILGDPNTPRDDPWQRDVGTLIDAFPAPQWGTLA